MDENIFRLNLQARHTKEAKVETAIWENAAAELFQGGYRDKHHEPIFQNVRNIMAKHLKDNVYRSFVCYMI